MKVIKKAEFPEAKFDLYFLGYDGPGAVSHGKHVTDREGLIELTHNYGTENDPEYKVNNGNAEPHRGFGHTCISVVCAHFFVLRWTPSVLANSWSRITSKQPANGSKMLDTNFRRSSRMVA